ncbi:MAG: hypothetical protein KGK15_15390 [Burkholderiales bacterium]|nr:hypothetical protein [Burkholderiales bacterium]
MIGLAKLLDGLMVLYILAATVFGVRTSHVHADDLLASIVGALLGVTLLIMLALPYYLSLTTLSTFHERRARLVRWLHRMLITLALGAMVLALINGFSPMRMMLLLMLVIAVSVVNLLALAQRRARDHRLGYS